MSDVSDSPVSIVPLSVFEVSMVEPVSSITSGSLVFFEGLMARQASCRVIIIVFSISHLVCRQLYFNQSIGELKMSILVINCGSSSIKLDIVDPDDGVRILKMRAIRLGSPGCTLKINGKNTKFSESFA